MTLDPISGDGTITTIQQHILTQQQRHPPEATGSFSWLLSGITLATKMIEARVRQAGLNDAVGSAGDINVQGETQQKLDVYADRALVHCLGVRENVAIIASEENEDAITFDGRAGTGRYVVVFDPLDGSSNIDVEVSVGTIFSILLLPEGLSSNDDPNLACLQPGVKQLAAGYVIYGSGTLLVLATRDTGVNGFTLDPSVGEFFLSHSDLKLRPSATTYSMNEGYAKLWDPRLAAFVDGLKEPSRKMTQRYIGSLVADFHRNLLKGGLFVYPATTKAPDGKLRVLYEAFPLALIAEIAGGAATNGRDPILDMTATSLHQRTPLVIGNTELVEECTAALNA